MQDFSILTVSSPFSFKTLFTKPLKYVIQIFTGDASEHAAKYQKGFVMNVSAKGFEKIPFDKWMERYSVNGAKIHEYILPYRLTPHQEELINAFDNKCLDKNYDVPAAMLSVFDEIKFIRILIKRFRKKEKGIFCSQQAFSSLVAGGIFPPQQDLVSPSELKKMLIKKGWKKNKIS
jgi:hypothetical protein